MGRDRGEQKARKETGSAKGNLERERLPGAGKENRSAKVLARKSAKFKAPKRAQKRQREGLKKHVPSSANEGFRGNLAPYPYLRKDPAISAINFLLGRFMNYM